MPRAYLKVPALMSVPKRSVGTINALVIIAPTFCRLNPPSMSLCVVKAP